MGWLLCLVFVLLLSSPPVSAADGTFSGKVINPPANQPVAPGWIFVQGRNRMLRRVEVAHAEIVFGEEVPVHQRRKCNADCLSAGQDVRVTARQDSAGEWRAKKVEILHIPTEVARTPAKVLALPIFTAMLSQQQLTEGSDSASHRIRQKSKYRCVGVQRYNEPVFFMQAGLVAGRSVL